MPPQRQHDPTLPPPWEALFDTDSGLRYYWNPKTNVTQYERPVGGPAPPPAPLPAYVSEYTQTISFPVGFSEPVCCYGNPDLLLINCLLVLQASSNGLSNGPAPYTNGHAKHVLPAIEQNFALTAEQYRAEHSLVVQGDRVPDPLQTFESAGFSSNIMDEVLFNRHSSAWPVAVA